MFRTVNLTDLFRYDITYRPVRQKVLRGMELEKQVIRTNFEKKQPDL
jgi:hypothetical protein